MFVISERFLFTLTQICRICVEQEQQRRRRRERRRKQKMKRRLIQSTNVHFGHTLLGILPFVLRDINVESRSSNKKWRRVEIRLKTDRCTFSCIRIYKTNVPIYTYTCITNLYTCTYMCLYIYVDIHMRICVLVYVICMCICICIYIHTSVCV